KATPSLAGSRRLDGCIERQQVGLVGDLADLVGHAAEFVGVAGDTINFSQEKAAVLLGLQQCIGDGVQALVGTLNGFNCAAALLVSVLRRTGAQALAQLGEAGRQPCNGFADLTASQCQVLPPQR